MSNAALKVFITGNRKQTFLVYCDIMKIEKITIYTKKYLKQRDKKINLMTYELKTQLDLYLLK